jgi:hypothetical protein
MAKATTGALPSLALVTAETRNELIVVKLATGKVLKRTDRHGPRRTHAPAAVR